MRPLCFIVLLFASCVFGEIIYYQFEDTVPLSKGSDFFCYDINGTQTCMVVGGDNVKTRKLVFIGSDVVHTQILESTYYRDFSSLLFEDSYYTIGGFLDDDEFDGKKYSIESDGLTLTEDSLNSFPNHFSGHKSIVVGSPSDQYGLILFGKVDNVLSNGIFAFFPSNNTLVDISSNFNTLPPKREFFSVSKVGSKLYVFGGKDGNTYMNDFWEIDIETYKCKEIDITNRPGIRSGHASSTTYDNQGLIIQGGYNGDAYLKSAFLYNITDNKWTVVGNEQSNIVPARAFHSMMPFDKGYLLLGGQNSSGLMTSYGAIYAKYDDVPFFRLDILLTNVYSYNFVPPTLGSTDLNCEILESGLINNCLQIGGSEVNGTEKTIYSMFEQVDDTIWKPAYSISISLDAIRHPVSFAFFDIDKYVMFGGRLENETGEFPQDALIIASLSEDRSPSSIGLTSIPSFDYFYGQKSIVLDMTTSYDFTVDITFPNEVTAQGLAFYGQVTDRISEETTVTDQIVLVYSQDNSTTVTFGAVDVTSLVQSKNSESPSPRYHHGMGYLNGNAYMFGGTNGSSNLDDFWVFDTATLIWKEIDKDDSSWPSSRFGHSLTPLKDIADKPSDAIILHGGTDNETYFGDVWMFNLTTSRWKKFSNESLIPRAFHLSIPSNLNGIVAIGGVNKDGPVAPFVSMTFATILYKPPIQNQNTPKEADPIGGNRKTPNHIIAGVAGGLFLILLVVVLVLGLSKRS